MLKEFRARHPYRELDINGTCWHYISCGQGNKTLLFLPGGFMTADMWFYSILALEKDYQVIAPNDHTLQGTFGMEDVCNAIVRILEAEGVEKATIIGISGGGGVAQYFIQEYPQKVENLVLSHCGIINAETVLRLQKQLKLIKILILLKLGRIIKWMAARKSEWGKNYPSSDWVEFRRAYLRECTLNLRKETSGRFWEEIFLPSYEKGIESHRSFVFKSEVLQSWPGEILLLSTKDDKWTTGSMEKLKARYPRAKTHMFEQGGHHTILLFPEEYNSVIRDFLKGRLR